MNHIKKYFEHLLDPQLIIIVLVIIMGCVALKMFFASKVDGFKDKYKTKFYIYVSAAVFTYALVPLMGYSRLFIDDKLYEFIFYQIASLGLGILHCFLYRYYFKKFESKEALTEYLFAILIVAFASIPFLLIFYLLYFLFSYTKNNAILSKFISVKGIIRNNKPCFLIPFRLQIEYPMTQAIVIFCLYGFIKVFFVVV